MFSFSRMTEKGGSQNAFEGILGVELDLCLNLTVVENATRGSY